MNLGEEYIRVKTWVLRVSIHCDECRKNVENRLRSIDGVYMVKVDQGFGAVNVRVTMSPDLSPDVLLKKIKPRRKRTYVQLLVPPPAAAADSDDDQDQDVLAVADAVAGEIEKNNVDHSEQLRPSSVKPSPSRRRLPVIVAENDNGEEELAEEECPVPDVEQAEEQGQGHKDDNVVVPISPPTNINARAACGSRASSRVASPREVNRPSGHAQMQPMDEAEAEAMDGGQNMGTAQPHTSDFPFTGAKYGDTNPCEHQLHGRHTMMPYYPVYSSSSYHYYYPAPPPPPAPTHKEDCTYKFNDENTNSCTVM